MATSSSPLHSYTILPTAIPKWFQYAVYMENKLAQCKRDNVIQFGVEVDTMPELLAAINENMTDYKKWIEETIKTTSGYISQSTADKKEAYLAKKYKEYNTPQRRAWYHFCQWGNKPNESISPNRWFESEYYIYSYAHKRDISFSTAKSQILNANLSCWQHYCNHGTAEYINPSRWFNTEKYIKDKATALGTSVEYVTTRIKNSHDFSEGVTAYPIENALTHAIRYAGDIINPKSGEVTAFVDVTHQVFRYPYCCNDDPWFYGDDPYYIYRNEYRHVAFMEDMV